MTSPATSFSTTPPIFPGISDGSRPLLQANNPQRTSDQPFGLLLSRASKPQSPEERARSTAQEFVGMALVQPILAQLRETNDAAGPFAPGVAERRFGHLWDAEIAHRIVQKQDFDLVNAVARRMQGNSSPKSASNEPQATAKVDIDG